MSKTLIKSETFNNTPIGNFPLDWDIVAIGDIATYVGSGITPKGGSNVYKKEGILFIRSQNVTFEGLLLDDVAHIDERIHKIMKRSEVFAHDVLLNITGASIGRCCPLPEGLGTANVNQHVCAIRLPNPNRENARFLSSALASYIGESQINKLNAGGNREGLNYQQLRAFLIPFPPTQERADIAKILDAIDKAIALTDTHITKLKKAKAGLLHDLLTRGIDEHGELRDYTRNPELFKRSPLGIIPKDWDVLSVEDILEGRPKNGYSPKEVNEWTGKLMLGLGCLTTNGFQPCQLKNAPANSLKIDTALLKDGDFLISRSNTRELVGLVGIYKDIGIPTIYPDLMMRLTPNKRITAYFLELLMKHEPVRRQLTRTAQGTSGSMVKINSKSVLSTVTAVPQPEEQQRILQAINEFVNHLYLKNYYLEKLKLLKKGLMSDLLTGRVRVKI